MDKFNVKNYMTRYEKNELKGNDVLKLFSNLIKTGKIWDLRGSYRRFANNLIDRGYISIRGKIIKLA